MKNIINMIAGVLFGLTVLFYMFIGAVLNNNDYSLKGTVMEQTYEGYTENNDYYIIKYEDGNIHEVEANNLSVGDNVITWFYRNKPIRTIYTGS